MSDELEGLAAAIDKSLKSHPGYIRGEDGIAACDGPYCDWRKTTRGSTKQAWLKHQKYTLSLAIEAWYYHEEKSDNT